MPYDILWTRLVENWTFDNSSRAEKDATNKGKLSRRVRRKTTGLLNGGWVTKVIS